MRLGSLYRQRLHHGNHANMTTAVSFWISNFQTSIHQCTLKMLPPTAFSVCNFWFSVSLVLPPLIMKRRIVFDWKVLRMRRRISECSWVLMRSRLISCAWNYFFVYGIVLCFIYYESSCFWKIEKSKIFVL